MATKVKMADRHEDEQAQAFAQRFSWDRAAHDTEQFLTGVARDRIRAVG